jgi:hypothetical protein
MQIIPITGDIPSKEGGDMEIELDERELVGVYLFSLESPTNAGSFIKYHQINLERFTRFTWT